MKLENKKARLVAQLARFILSLRYNVTVINNQELEDVSTCIFLPNHKALIDPLLIGSHIFKYKFVSAAVADSYYNNAVFKPVLQLFKCIPVSDIEAGNRDVNVLNKITESITNALINNNNIMLYPSGQISSTASEKIRNKQSVHKLVPLLPKNVKIIGVRISGLWGSLWSKACSKKTPDFFKTFLKGFLIVVLNLIFFVPKRKVKIEFIDISSEIKEKSKLERKEFNQFLEEFYNIYGDEKLSKVKYHFSRIL